MTICSCTGVISFPLPLQFSCWHSLVVALSILDSLLLDDDVEVTSDCIPELLTDSNGTDGSNLFVSIAVQLVGNNPVAQNPLFECSGLKEQLQSFAIKPIQ